jgi:hypothetical protein
MDTITTRRAGGAKIGIVVDVCVTVGAGVCVCEVVAVRVGVCVAEGVEVAVSVKAGSRIGTAAAGAWHASRTNNRSIVMNTSRGDFRVRCFIGIP